MFLCFLFVIYFFAFEFVVIGCIFFNVVTFFLNFFIKKGGIVKVDTLNFVSSFSEAFAILKEI